MDDHEMERHLQSIGKQCFVEYYPLLCNQNIPSESVAITITEEKNYRTYDTTLGRRVKPARRIIDAGRARDALLNISESRVPYHIRREAKRLAGEIRYRERRRPPARRWWRRPIR